MDNINPKLLMSQAKFYEGYSRYLEDKDRYETWNEAVERVMNMHKDKYKDVMSEELKLLIDEVEEGYKEKLFLGAQRALQFGGEQLRSHEFRLYNCTASHCDRPDFFGGMTYLLLCGAGVGFSVQKQHISKLPKIKKRSNRAKTYAIEDSIEGWAEAIDVLMSTYFEKNQVHPEYFGKKIHFDYSKIREKGAYISGGFKAPGAEPLRKAINLIEDLLEKEVNNGIENLRSIVAYDIAMHIADAVISGGKK